MKTFLKKCSVILAVLMLALAFAACSDKKTSGGIGDTLSTMFFDYTVVSAESPSEYDGYTPEDGNKLLLLSVKVKNDFGSTLPMYDDDFQLQWGDGEYTWAVRAFNSEMMPAEWELENKKTATYDMLFEVPANETEFSLAYLEIYTDRNNNAQTGDVFSITFTVK